MILVESKIEGIEVSVEVDERAEENTYSSVPTINTDCYVRSIQEVDVLTIVKAVKTAETVEEFIDKVQNTWTKEKTADPIIKSLNDEAVNQVFRKLLKVLEYTFTDSQKELFEMDNGNSVIYGACRNYASNYDGSFYKLDKDERMRYLVQSALADC